MSAAVTVVAFASISAASIIRVTIIGAIELVQKVIRAITISQRQSNLLH